MFGLRHRSGRAQQRCQGTRRQRAAASIDWISKGRGSRTTNMTKGGGQARSNGVVKAPPARTSLERLDQPTKLHPQQLSCDATRVGFSCGRASTLGSNTNGQKTPACWPDAAMPRRPTLRSWRACRREPSPLLLKNWGTWPPRLDRAGALATSCFSAWLTPIAPGREVNACRSRHAAGTRAGSAAWTAPRVPRSPG